jgi:diguanylate cyclase (GGDEF)-like protein
MAKLRLSFKQKLLLGIALSIFLVFGTGGLITGWLIQERLVEQARQQMDMTGKGIHAVVRSLVLSSIKNYLKGLSEANLAYVQYAYSRFQAGEFSEQEAKNRAEGFLLRQRIGDSGYATAVDISDGGIKLAVHPHLKGKDLSGFAFAREMARQKSGYLEFEWKNPGDPAPRMKSEWMSFFAPWQWIISAAPFRDEYPKLVDLEGIEAELAKMEMPVQSYAFIMDTQGTLLLHPTWKGRKMIDTVDAVTGEPLVRRMLDAAVHGVGAGDLLYRIKDPASDRIFARLMTYRYVPEVNWVVGIVTDVERLEAPLRVVRNTQAVVMVVSLLVSLLVIVWAVRPMTRSIGELAAAVAKIDRGNLDTPLPSASNDEIGQLSLAFSRMAERLGRYTDDLEQRVAERTAALEEANRKLAALSATDGLTGLANRRRFDEALDAEWRRARRTGQSLALALLDVDLFKRYNDHYGHQEGDTCLKTVARILQASVRRPGDVAARYGGEEFAVIAPNIEPAGAFSLCESIRAAIESLAIPHDQSPFAKVTVSIGVAIFDPESGQDAETLLREADGALYGAKHDGRNRVVLSRETVA